MKANPSLIPNQPFLENIFPGAKNLYINGSASANFFYDVFGNYSGSFLDGLNDMDRIRQPNGGCISVFGCNTFYPTQDSGLESYVNAGKSAYNGLTIVLRRPVSHGWGFDFNYTWSHAIDNGSASETSGGAPLQDAFNANAYRGPADYDARHTITANGVWELPFGHGKQLLGSAPMWLDEMIGGWQLSTIYTFRTGAPLTCSDSGVYNVNYEYSSFCILNPGSALPATSSLTFDQTGAPSIFANTNVNSAFVASYPGVVGTRGIVRGPHFWNDDLAISKFFRLPKEGYRLQLRGEGYNVLNHENFGTPALSISSPTTFGEITSTAGGSAPRVLQLAMRFEF